MNAIELKSRAQKLTVKVNKLGFSKDGKPMVLDQAYELVAAELGFRNQHALRAQLTAPASDSMQGWIDVVNAQGWNETSEIIHLEGFIVTLGLAAQLAEYARNAASEENCDADDISTEQFVESGESMREAIAALESRWGVEHEYYDREDWKQDVSAGDTKLGYWEWVQHNIESHGDDEAHCTKCGCPDADNGEGEDGLCGNCADAAFRENENADDDLIDIADLAETLKIDLDDAKFWVGLHYKVNFDAEPNGSQVDWLNRYHESHGLTPANSTTSSDADRAAADLVFEEYKFGEHFSVGGVNGWETCSGDSLWTRNVYLEDSREPNEPTKLVKFTVEVNNGTVVNISVK